MGILSADRLAVGLAMFLGLTAGLALAAQDVSHQVTFPGLKQQYVTVVSEFPVTAPVEELRMASWNPGSYLIREFAADLDRIEVRNGEGVALPFHKVRKNAWSVEAGDSGTLVVEYQVHAGDLEVQTSWASEDFILLNGATIFLYTEASRPLPQTVRVQALDELPHVVTPLAGTKDGSWQAKNFDELVDSPIVITANAPHPFEVDGHRYQLQNVGDEHLWDTEKSVQDLARVVAGANALWGAVPLERDYWFFNFLVERGGGLEHDHGTVLMTSRWQTRKQEDYIDWLSLAAHEYLHLWNVRNMRPASLGTYDLDAEQYSPALWLAEGFTSYYDNLTLARTQLVTPEQYLRLLAKDVHRLEMTPGRRLISLEQASRDAWIRLYRQDANSINSTISYYTKGALVGFALDARIRETSEDRRTLDDVMRLMWENWGDKPYPRGAFRDAVEAVAGAGVRTWLEPLLSTPEDPDLDRALAYYGLRLDRDPQLKSRAEAGDPTPAGLGVNWDTDSDRLLVGSVVAGFSGSSAGLLPGDELLAIDGERVLREDVDDRLARLAPGAAVELLLARRGRLQSLRMELGEGRPEHYEIVMDEKPGKRERKRLEQWLGTPVAGSGR